jgi:ribonuclease HI
MPEFTCGQCGKSFNVPQAALDKYPGWTPKICRDCKGGASRGGRVAPGHRAEGGARLASGRGGGGALEENLPVAEVLARYTAGPKSGVFTDGAAHPNPGPGGFGAVYVVDDRIVGERWGHEPQTTNNRMELAALLAGLELVPVGTAAVMWTDSQLCVNTFTKWAKGWEARGWRRKEGAIKNLELVQAIYYELRARPELELKWIAAHSGYRWNEYADSLATAYRRRER